MVPDQVPLTCRGIGRFALASGPLAAVCGVGGGAPEPECRPVMKNAAATIATMQARQAVAHRAARERPLRGCCSSPGAWRAGAGARVAILLRRAPAGSSPADR